MIKNLKILSFIYGTMACIFFMASLFTVGGISSCSSEPYQDTIVVHDSIPIPYWDTTHVYDTTEIFDTIIIPIYDTIHVSDTNVVYDTTNIINTHVDTSCADTVYYSSIDSMFFDRKDPKIYFWGGTFDIPYTHFEIRNFDQNIDSIDVVTNINGSIYQINRYHHINFTDHIVDSIYYKPGYYSGDMQLQMYVDDILHDSTPTFTLPNEHYTHSDTGLHIYGFYYKDKFLKYALATDRKYISSDYEIAIFVNDSIINIQRMSYVGVNQRLVYELDHDFSQYDDPDIRVDLYDVSNNYLIDSLTNDSLNLKKFE